MIIKYADNTEILINPDSNSLYRKLNECKIIKGFIDSDNIYIWNAFEKTHYQIKQLLNLLPTVKDYYLLKYNLPCHSYNDFIIHQNKTIIFDSLGDYHNIFEMTSKANALKIKLCNKFNLH